jgi:ribulose-5-phosphate 4-epimerase/fuculose-1-phosphate aldolase
MTTLKDCLQMIVKANHILAREGVVDALGHVSMRHPDDPGKFLLARSQSPALVQESDIQIFDLDGVMVEKDDRRPYLERFIHAGVYANRPDVVSVVHDHSVEVLPFSISSVPLKAALHTTGIIGEEVPVWDIRENFGDTNMLVSNIEQGRDLAKRMGKSATALMRGHGAVVASHGIIESVLIAIYLNVNAEAQMRAISLGGKVNYLNRGEVEKAGKDALISPLASKRAWDYFLQRAGYDIGG